MRSLHDSKTTVALLAGLTLVGALAGCTGTSADAGSPDTGTGTEPSADAVYADGTYEAAGEYQAPSGTESVDVTITLEGDIITAVEVVGGASDPQAKIQQGNFVGGISAAVVGKDIDAIQVDKVGGSSLTSGGFNKAVDAIKAEAAA